MFQGDLINRIENHVQLAVEHVEMGVTETKKAIKYKKKANVVSYIHKEVPGKMHNLLSQTPNNSGICASWEGEF